MKRFVVPIVLLPAQVFDPPSKYLYFLSDDGVEFKYLRRRSFMRTGSRSRSLFSKAQTIRV